MKKLLVLIAAILATTAALADKPYPPKRMYDVYNAWNMVCFELRDVDCTGMKVPKVLTFEPKPRRKGLMGYYTGGDTIWVRENLRQKSMEEVLAHEMSHYIDMKLGLLNPVFNSDLSRCFSEKRAWAVSDAYNRVYGKYSRIVGSEWTRWYTHCTPYRDKLYPKT